MKEQIILLLYKTFLFFVRVVSNDIIKTRTYCNTLLYNKIYVKVFETYKENTIKKNNEFSKYLYESILDFNSEIDEENREKLNLLKNEILENESNLIAKHYILSAYFSYYISKNSIFTTLSKAEIRTNLKSAKKFNSKVKLLKIKDYSALKKDIKTDLKNISNRIKMLNKEKIEQEKLKSVEPIDIKMSNIITLFSIVSTLSLIGGIIYNQLLFYFLGMNVSNFFNISDYISSSIDMLSIVFLTMLLGIPFYFLRFSHFLNEVIIDEQFGTNTQDKNDKMEFISKWIIVASLFGFVILDYYNNKQINFNLLGVFLYIVIVFLLPSLSIWKYFKNPFAVNLSILILLNFLYLVTTKAYNQVNEIKDDDFNSEYNVVLKENIKDKYNFIQTNSNYTFLYSKDKKKVIVIPNTEIKKIEYIPKKTD